MTEPNDTLLESSAAELTLETPFVSITETIGDNANADLDVDIFQVTLNAGDRLTIDIDTFGYPEDLTDSVLRLFDENGVEVAFSDDGAAPDELWSYDSFINFVATTSGTYYIGVSGYGNSWYDPVTGASGTSGATGNYTLDMTLSVDAPIIGTPEADSLTGTEFDDTISGLAGADLIAALGGGDEVNAGEGNDVVSGGLGNDSIDGGQGNDQLLGESGDDTISGGSGADLIIGDEDENYDFGYDQLFGGGGSDTIFGGDADDWLTGGEGDDQLDGGYASDYLEGGNGNDLLRGWGGYYEIDYLTGGNGRDTFILGDEESAFYDDGDPSSTGDLDYALITDFNVLRDTIQLHGSADSYTLDYFVDYSGIQSAALVLDGASGRAETIAILQNVVGALDLTSSAFQYV
ncbi:MULTISPECIES: pre-peptidase C-terminal domain-containing protein [unclassified Leptolyngbya]|uniref:calcium-binding protein n=1 Tax=unclassified Leptolyngbya TaxID=2650499 RepID=UPI001689D039|nr:MULTISPECIES: pre-peptidase C-terminal domain-containing protein [unclassified Leptolyngbya]MBD1913906.1 pre-peptidase C-terminal domain-containing protein [Leptolyngbya sp. FACHB-8]MBD2156358.1 pre-peptidase C-terminal domain-containing protein [Leptolyngbya sp. FACHB-16]